MAQDIDSRVLYYTRGESAYNFGDYLTEYFLGRMLGEPFVDAAHYRLVGSAISDALVDQDLRGLPETSRLSYWCCGARGEEGLTPHRQERCDFWGVRGPLTRRALALPEDTPLGDPGFLVPLVHTARPMAALKGKTASMVHFSALSRSEALRGSVGADVALSPSVSSIEELEQLFDQIASVDFLLTASLHGAIIACAYGTPFAFWDYGEIDIPFKWQDTCALLGIDARFHDQLLPARRWWEMQSGKLARPALAPMLAACPFAVRPRIWQQALRADGAAGHPMDQVVGFDRDDWIDMARERNLAARKKPVDQGRASQVARAELASALGKLSEASHHIEQRMRALDVDFRQTPTVNFADKSSGHALLGAGWSPANDVAPWSLPPYGEIILPMGAGWEEAQTLSLSGYLFAPKLADGQAERSVYVWLNAVKAFEATFTNSGEADSVVVNLSMAIPPHLKGERDLSIRLYLSPVPSPSELGLFNDPRPIGFAPLRMTLS